MGEEANTVLSELNHHHLPKAAVSDHFQRLPHRAHTQKTQPPTERQTDGNVRLTARLTAILTALTATHSTMPHWLHPQPSTLRPPRDRQPAPPDAGRPPHQTARAAASAAELSLCMRRTHALDIRILGARLAAARCDCARMRASARRPCSEIGRALPGLVARARALSADAPRPARRWRGEKKKSAVVTRAPSDMAPQSRRTTLWTASRFSFSLLPPPCPHRPRSPTLSCPLAACTASPSPWTWAHRWASSSVTAPASPLSLAIWWGDCPRSRPLPPSRIRWAATRPPPAARIRFCRCRRGPFCALGARLHRRWARYRRHPAPPFAGPPDSPSRALFLLAPGRRRAGAKPRKEGQPGARRARFLAASTRSGHSAVAAAPAQTGASNRARSPASVCSSRVFVAGAWRPPPKTLGPRVRPAARQCDTRGGAAATRPTARRVSPVAPAAAPRAARTRRLPARAPTPGNLHLHTREADSATNWPPSKKN